MGDINHIHRCRVDPVLYNGDSASIVRVVIEDIDLQQPDYYQELTV